MEATLIICLVLLVICIFAVKSYARRLSSGCCGAGGDKKEKRVKVDDTEEEHYPIRMTLAIDGMTCGNCVRRVENALNRLDGVWASAELSKGIARVRMKKEIDEDILRQTVRSAGYSVISIKKEP